ncbi:MAG TPA: hypothetical protein VLT79_06380 [Gemmatimonadales bacterium]|nr:hypothetical protein [Gemmatimonadales bacterium]
MGRSATTVVLILACSTISEAQQAPPERIGVGIAITGVAGSKPWAIASARIGIPMATRFGLDADAGGTLGTERLNEGQVPSGGAADLHVRWMHGGRHESGWSGYLMAGPRVIAAHNIDASGQVTNHDPIWAFEAGYGVDWLTKNGWRGGVELGIGAGEPLLGVTGFLLWGRH